MGMTVSLTDFRAVPWSELAKLAQGLDKGLPASCGHYGGPGVCPLGALTQ
jgi:hypothetical protein